ncbi:polysaccharide pyruvyl transferase family protein [Aliiroseovarius sp. S1339]|uniref:polysaccharide pyruvyl transferase family protein n=1 Tax=Aliiroseovarius sp. S1339 TaxID=2936990 RepID=UPI0020BEFB35|nr:polysaccharide pyruvyl transferase family protein [Aliiroseovarius sp. S1339]MCK8465067.1 polysaccharide pyruvyl transferase family protein [Aliiroseovarius sp. S1339]
MIHVVLIFHGARNDNLGVGALTASEVEILRTISQQNDLDIAITIVDGRGARPVYITGSDVTVEDIRVLRHPMQFYKLVRKADCVIDIGAGDSFTDIYGRKRLIRLFLMKYLTHIARRPLVLAPQTVGPFTSWLSKLLAGQSIRRCAVISTRDAMSTECARDLGVNGTIIEASDVALRLPYTPAPKRDKTGPVKVGINVSGLLMSGGYSGKNMFGLGVDYRSLIHELIQQFLDHPDDIELHFVPHVISWETGSVEDDLHACRVLAEEYPSSKMAPTFTTPSEAKSYIAGLDFFMGARMHSCIAAFSSGVPVVPMAYSRKFEGLFGSLGYHYTVDCKQDSHDTILQRTLAAYDSRDEVAKIMNEAFERGLKTLDQYQQALEQLLLSLDKGKSRS